MSSVVSTSPKAKTGRQVIQAMSPAPISRQTPTPACSPNTCFHRGAGTPRSPEDLAQHECLLWTRDNRVYDEWPLGVDGTTTLVRVQGRIHVNDGMALAATACAGAGITLIDRLLVEQELADGTLVELLTHCSLPPGPPLYAVYPARQWLALNTSTFVAFLLSRKFAQRV